MPSETAMPSESTMERESTMSRNAMSRSVPPTSETTTSPPTRLLWSSMMPPMIDSLIDSMLMVSTIVGLEGRRDPPTCRAATARVGPAVAAEWPDEPPAVEWEPDAHRSGTVFGEPAASCERSTTGQWHHRADRDRAHGTPSAIREVVAAARFDCASEPAGWR